jgi:hypothetical protein
MDSTENISVTGIATTWLLSAAALSLYTKFLLTDLVVVFLLGVVQALADLLTAKHASKKPFKAVEAFTTRTFIPSGLLISIKIISNLTAIYYSDLAVVHMLMVFNISLCLDLISNSPYLSPSGLGK